MDCVTCGYDQRERNWVPLHPFEDSPLGDNTSSDTKTPCTPGPTHFDTSTRLTYVPKGPFYRSRAPAESSSSSHGRLLGFLSSSVFRDRRTLPPRQEKHSTRRRSWGLVRVSSTPIPRKEDRVCRGVGYPVVSEVGPVRTRTYVSLSTDVGTPYSAPPTALVPSDSLSSVVRSRYLRPRTNHGSTLISQDKVTPGESEYRSPETEYLLTRAVWQRPGRTS